MWQTECIRQIVETFPTSRHLLDTDYFIQKRKAEVLERTEFQRFIKRSDRVDLDECEKALVPFVELGMDLSHR